MTIKRENGKYYAIVNITTTVEELEKTGKSIGIDLGLKNLATLSNGQEITNLDLKREDKMIQKYQKKLSRQKYMSKNYQKTLKKYYKWTNRKKQQNTKRIPPTKQKTHNTIRHNRNGKPKHKRNV